MLETSVSLVLMIAELMAAECIFALRLKRKSLFFLRLIGAFVVILEAVFFMVLIFYRSTDILFSYGGASEWKESLFKFFLYVTAFVMTILGMKFCYDDSVWVIMFYCSGAYATQHLAKNVASLISFFTALRLERKGKTRITTVLPGGVYTRPDIVQDIENQGIWGKLSAKTPGFVAKKSLKAARKNKAVYIPGFFNKFLNFVMKIVPKSISMRFIAHRWKKQTKDAF